MSDHYFVLEQEREVTGLEPPGADRPAVVTRTAWEAIAGADATGPNRSMQFGGLLELAVQLIAQQALNEGTTACDYAAFPLRIVEVEHGGEEQRSVRWWAGRAL